MTDRREPDEPDDEALSWEGDEELGRATSLTGAGPARDVPVSAKARAREAERSAADRAVRAARADEAAAPRDVPLLIATLLFGLVYLAYEVAWILAIQGAGGALASSSGGGFAGALASVSNFFALLAAALWFVITVHLTRGGRRIHRIGFLALGLALLLPWPFLSGLVS